VTVSGFDRLLSGNATNYRRNNTRLVSSNDRYRDCPFHLLLLNGCGFCRFPNSPAAPRLWDSRGKKALLAGKSLTSSGLAPLIAKMGFPIPVALALWITFNESIGAFLVACGFLTRLAAASLALGMAGALYTSVRLGEDWLRAALYLIIFAALSLTGPGKFSFDHLLKRKKSPAMKG